MSSENLKEKIQIAKDAVKDQEEPYKTEAFKIILSSLIGGSTIQPKGNGSSLVTGSGKRKRKPSKKKTSNVTPIQLTQKNDFDELSKNCGISTDELSEVLTIKNNTIQIIKRPKIKESEKHVLFSICILGCYKILYEIEWLPSTILKKCLDASAVGDINHYAEAVAKESNILPRGDGKGREYKITGKGLDKAYDLIKKLSKDESIIEN